MISLGRLGRTHKSSCRYFSCSANNFSKSEGRRTYDASTILEDEKKGIFRVFQIGRPKNEMKKSLQRRRSQEKPPPPRSANMKPDQPWGNVWPAARTFHPATVPLPVRQGVVQTKAQVVPSKYANAELMKIPNFLHLTPPVISTHCSALSKFCTEWPKGLETDEDIEKHFPITVTTSDYLNSNSSIRDRRARIVQFKLNIDCLSLDTHARDKLIRLVGERYQEDSGEITLVADRCPYRGQNEDYCKYLLTALFHESWNVEDWEDKGVKDEETYKGSGEEEREALKALLNYGEDQIAVLKYKEETRKLLGLPATESIAEYSQTS